jgi:hypothetical protein
MRRVACNHCHDDHKGRDADIVELDPALFDHEATDFPLRESHVTVPCAACHAKEKRLAEAPSTCGACHEDDDRHAGNLGTRCESCHFETSWPSLKPFDHGKTSFPLRGRHADTACMACHLGELYKGLPAACNDCHALQDVHRQRFGTACQNCHGEESWKAVRFDHGVSARFVLEGAHGRATCRACHGNDIVRPLASGCSDCHADEDAHRGQLGAACGDCHGAESWTKAVRFDHDLTSYPLVGFHAAAACETCHEAPTYQDAESTCASCHRAEDVHAGRFTARCETCHGATGWNSVAFDHDRDTTYRLTGKHRTTACYGCHAARNVADASLPTDCISCHARQDVHRGKFGRDCARCHDTATFGTAIIGR